MPDATVGKDVEEGETLNVFLSPKSRSTLEMVRDKLRPDEIDLLDE